MPTSPRARNPYALPDTLQFMRLLWAVVHGLERVSKRMTAEVGVTGPQRLVLRVVGLFPGVSAGELAAILHVHPSTLTGVLRRLVTHRLLLRVSDKADRRRAVLRLSASGERINAATAGTVEHAVARALMGTRSQDRECTRRLLSHIADHLEGNGRKAREPHRPAARRSAGTLAARKR